MPGRVQPGRTPEYPPGKRKPNPPTAPRKKRNTPPMAYVHRAIRSILPTLRRHAARVAGIGAASAVLAGGVVVPVVANAGPFAPSESLVAQAAPAAEPTKPAAKPAAARPAAKKQASRSAARPAPPTARQLHPRGIPAYQVSFTPNADQIRNARAIVKTGQQLHLPPRAWVIAVATACQESQLHNLGNLGSRNDHDSLGLFQQRPSSGWGTPRQVTNPTYASTKFYQALVRVPGWWRMPLTQAAQRVQVSAFPNHYAKWEKHAGNLVLATYSAGPYAKQAAATR